MLHYANVLFILYRILKLLTYHTSLTKCRVINAQAGPVFLAHLVVIDCVYLCVAVVYDEY